MIRTVFDQLDQYSSADHSMRSYGPHPDSGERLLAERAAAAGDQNREANLDLRDVSGGQDDMEEKEAELDAMINDD